MQPPLGRIDPYARPGYTNLLDIVPRSRLVRKCYLVRDGREPGRDET